MKVGILGGTFNPVHNGHMAMAEVAFRQLVLDKVLLMPTGNPPHKHEIISGVHRLNMVRLAIKGIPYLEASDYELNRDGIIYTADTLELLARQNPDTRYTFIIGGDSYAYIEKWYHPECIMKLASIAVCARDGEDMSDMIKRREYLVSKYDADIELLNFRQIDVSSSGIRRSLMAGHEKGSYSGSAGLCHCITGLNKEVFRYIIDNHLYASHNI